MRSPGTQCIFETCVEEVHAVWLCPAHHAQWYRGEPLSVIRPFKTPEERFWRDVDKRGEDECWNWTGKLQQGRGRFQGRGRLELAHVYSYELHSGKKVPEGKEIDHKCQNPSCVNPQHLRPVTRTVNAQNKALAPGNTSGYKGVHWNRKLEKWQARVTHEGRRWTVGYASTAIEAGRMALEARMKHWADGNKYDQELAKQFGIDYPEW